MLFFRSVPHIRGHNDSLDWSSMAFNYLSAESGSNIHLNTPTVGVMAHRISMRTLSGLGAIVFAKYETDQHTVESLLAPPTDFAAQILRTHTHPHTMRT